MKKIKQGDKTKDFILEESNMLFYKQGYAVTSFNDIVEKTGLSKGNITYHFKSKQKILEGVIAQRLLATNRAIQQWEAKSSDPLERLKMFCEMIVKEEKNLIAYGCSMGTLTSEFAKYTTELHEITLILFSRYREWIAQQYEALRHTSKSSDALAMSLLARVQGIALMTHVFKEKDFLEAEIQKVKESLDPFPKTDYSPHSQ